MLIILGIGAVPVAWSFVLSFQADDLVPPSRFGGFDNYRLPEMPRAVRIRPG